MKYIDIVLLYRALPYAIQQKVTYKDIEKHIFFGAKFPSYLQKIIRVKREGYSTVESFKKARIIAREYGCANAKDLQEVSLMLEKTETCFERSPSSEAGNTAWQKAELN